MAQRPEIQDELDDEPVGGSTRYLAIWAVMACLAAVYLAAVSLRPAFLDGILPVANAGAGETALQNAAEIVHLRDGVSQLQTDVDKIQTESSQQATATRSLSERVTALEQRSASAEPQSDAAAEPQRTSAAHPDAGSDHMDFPSGFPTSPRTAEAPPAKAPAAKQQAAAKQPKVLNSPIETGSVADEQAAPAAAAPPQAQPKAKPAADKVAAFSEPKVKKAVGIKLATGASVDNLRMSWGILSERHGAELKPLQPRYFNTVDGNGITYELVAGPFKSTAEAKKVCDSLKAQAIDCSLSNFGGNSL